MAEITINDLTEKTLDGAGVFDVLMQTIQLRLESEYKLGRIKGQEYANVYLGAVQATIDQSLRFLLEKQTADKQAELLTKQIAIADAQLTQAAQDLLNSQKQGLLLDSQVSKSDNEVALLNQRLKTERAEIESIIDGVPVVGRIGSQTALYDKQKESFDNKVKQDAAKLMADVFTILYSTVPEAVSANDNGFAAARVKATIDELLSTAGVP